MRGDFQKLLVSQDGTPAVLSLNVQAAMGPVREPERSQFVLLMRHFLERFFNHETASPDGDGKTRLVLLAFAAGVPGFMVAVWLWPVYHRFRGWPPGSTQVGPPPYWVQVNHHFFFVLYSLVVMGLIALFEWDLFFPDLLDVVVLGTLPVAQRRVFFGRAAAIAIFIGGFLFDANILAPAILPAATDPPHIAGFLAGHMVAVAAGGLFGAGSVIALQSVLLAIMGERLFRRVSLVLQGAAVTALVMLLLLFPVLSGITPRLLQSHNGAVLLFPPYWFLGMYQMLVDGAETLPIFRQLAQIGLTALAVTLAIGVVAYPVAYLRRVKYLLEGAPTRTGRNGLLAPFNRLLHLSAVRKPIGRAVFHFINQTLFRVPRYRIYLVLYGGVGLSVLIATVLRLTVVNGHLHAEASADGIRVAVGIAAFWVTTGLRTAFVSSGNQQGSWIYRFTHGRPAHFDAAMDVLKSAKLWVMLCAVTITELAVGALWLVTPAGMFSFAGRVAQILVGGGMCVVLTDALFANVMMMPFTGEPSREKPNLAFTLLLYFTFFPAVTGLSMVSDRWIEEGWQNFGVAAIAIVVIHLWFRYKHREVVRIHSAQAELEDGEEDFPMRLGLKY
jgi:hypothetical protein